MQRHNSDQLKFKFFLLPSCCSTQSELEGAKIAAESITNKEKTANLIRAQVRFGNFLEGAEYV